MADPTPLNRNQISRFVGNDPDAIRAIERLFVVAGQLTPVDIATLKQLILDNSLALGVADNKAEVAQADATAAKRLADLLAMAPVRETHNSVATDYVDLNVNAPIPADVPGRAYWNLDDGTVDVDLYNGSVLQVGQETHFFARNTSGGLVAKGTPVMFTGTVGVSGKLTFGLAVADGSVPADYMMGVTDQDIADNDFGYVISFGLLRGFNTTGAPYGQVWADGDLLYFDPATPGAWTNVQPVAPNIGVPVAVVVNAAPGGAGSIFVRMKVSESLNNLQDVFINGIGTPADKDLLEYNAANSRWENVAPGTISVGNAATATALQTARSIGGVSFNGTADINLPGVNIAGNQNTTGSAASLTTARTFTIGSTGKTFNGTADVAWSLSEIGVGTLGQQNSNGVSITGGSINGTTVGASTASTGAFTTLSASTSLATSLVTNAGTVALSATGANVITASTDSLERFRISELGVIGFGTTNFGIGTNANGGFYSPAEGRITLRAENSAALILRRWSSNGTVAQFRNTANTVVGDIVTAASTTAYNTSSDYRLKEDVQPMVGAVERVMALKPVNYAWKVDGSRANGFLAHELQEVIPQAVTGKKDAVDENGDPVYQGVDHSKIVPDLASALQEALTKIEALEARIASLEA